MGKGVVTPRRMRTIPATTTTVTIPTEAPITAMMTVGNSCWLGCGGAAVKNLSTALTNASLVESDVNTIGALARAL